MTKNLNTETRELAAANVDPDMLRDDELRDDELDAVNGGRCGLGRFGLRANGVELIQP